MALEFRFRIHPIDQAAPKPVARPFARVQLSDDGLQTPWESFALVDSGAKISLFPQSFAQDYLTGLDFSDQHRNRGTVIWRGISIPIWLHEMEVRLKGDPRDDKKPPRIIWGKGKVAFWKDRTADGKMLTAPAPYPLLGQIGALDHLAFTLLAGQKIFQLAPDVTLHHPWKER